MSDKDQNPETPKTPIERPPASGSRGTPGSILYEPPPGTPRRNGPAIIVVAIALAVVAALGIWLWRHRAAGKGAEDEKADVVVSVQVAKAERQAIASTATALGTVNPRLQATVSPKINGQIAEMGLLRNAPVKAGQVLAVLETRDLQGQRDEATAALAEARASLRSLSGGSIPQQTAQAEKDLRDAQANVNNAQALYEIGRASCRERGEV